MCSDLPATEERLIPVLILQSMVVLYDPTAENNAIGADAAHALTSPKRMKSFTQDISPTPRENTSEASAGFVSDLGHVHLSGMWWPVLDDTVPWYEQNLPSLLPLTRTVMTGLDPRLGWTRRQHQDREPDLNQGCDRVYGRDGFGTGDRDCEGETESPTFTVWLRSVIAARVALPRMAIARTSWAHNN